MTGVSDAGNARNTDDTQDPVSNENELRQSCPIRPLGHSAGSYYVISAAGQFVEISGSQLEAGRSVENLFIEGTGRGIRWCVANFTARGGDWCRKTLGKWIMSECGRKGVIDPTRLDFRKVGTWRGKTNNILVHCGSHVEDHAGNCIPLDAIDDTAEWVTDASISPPARNPASDEDMMALHQEVCDLWGWQRKGDAALWLGWLGMASLGGFPDWRTHLYIVGRRGSGKTELMECGSLLLGSMAGDVLNDASEAGIRQQRNHQARALLLDEAEPTPNSSKMSNLIALSRRMSGGAGGKVARGTANHQAISFSMIGAVYLSSIIQQPLDAQDRSRFMILRLKQIPKSDDPLEAGNRLRRFRARAGELGPKLWRRMIQNSDRWDATVQLYAGEAQRLGADPREAMTCAGVVAGFDLLMHADAPDTARLEEMRPLLEASLSDQQHSDESSEGDQCVQHLMAAFLPASFPEALSVADAIKGTHQSGQADHGQEMLGKSGIKYVRDKDCLYISSGARPQLNQIFQGTKWVNGAHKSALETLDGVTRPQNSQRIGSLGKVRVLEIPLALCGLDLELDCM